MTSSQGYGFVVDVHKVATKNRAGKAVMTVAEQGSLLKPAPIENIDEQWVACVTNIGNLLIFPVAELPILSKGKGQKLINIPGKKFQENEESLVGVAILSAQDSLSVNYSNGKTRILKPTEQELYVGDRALRGKKLEKKRGYNTIASLSTLRGKR